MEEKKVSRKEKRDAIKDVFLEKKNYLMLSAEEIALVEKFLSRAKTKIKNIRKKELVEQIAAAQKELESLGE